MILDSKPMFKNTKHNFAIEYYKGIATNTLENIITQGLPDRHQQVPAASGDLKPFTDIWEY